MGQQRLYLELAWLSLSARREWFCCGPFIAPPAIFSKASPTILQVYRLYVPVRVWVYCVCVRVCLPAHTQHTDHWVCPIKKVRDALTYRRIMSQFIKEPLGRSPLALQQFVRIRNICFLSLGTMCWFKPFVFKMVSETLQKENNRRASQTYNVSSKYFESLIA